MIGAGVFSKDAKSCGGSGAIGFSVVGEDDSDSVDDTERRFVRTGVRMGSAGGSLDVEDVGERWREGGRLPAGGMDNGNKLVLIIAGSSSTVSGGPFLFRIFWLPSEPGLRIVLWLGLRWIWGCSS